MKVFREFCCESCALVSEKYINNDIRMIECECGGNAVQLMSAPRSKLDGTSGDFPDAHDRWARIREDNARIKAKRN